MQHFLSLVLLNPLKNLSNIFKPPHIIPTISIWALLSVADGLYHIISLICLPRHHSPRNLTHLTLDISRLWLIYQVLIRKDLNPRSTINEPLKQALIVLNLAHVLTDICYHGILHTNLTDAIQITFLNKLGVEQLWRLLVLDMMSAGIFFKFIYLLMCLKLASIFSAPEWMDLFIQLKFFYAAIILVGPIIANSLNRTQESTKNFPRKSILTHDGELRRFHRR